MNKIFLLSFLLVTTILPLTISACGILQSNNIVTVESIYYLVETKPGGEEGLAIFLKPTSDAKASTVYAVDLFESNRYRASKDVSWSESELSIFTTKRLVYSIPEAEVESYMIAGKQLDDVFTINIKAK